MTNKQGQFKTDSQELEQIISEATKKIGAKKENDICRYLPISKGGYIHHFTMRKMKTENPDELASMIKKHIIESSEPKSVPPRPRAPRGSRKRRDNQLLFSKEDLDRMLNMARLAGDTDMVRKLTPKRDLKQIKKELLSSIRNNKVDHELWNCYVESVTVEAAPSAQTANVRV